MPQFKSGWCLQIDGLFYIKVKQPIFYSSVFSIGNARKGSACRDIFTIIRRRIWNTEFNRQIVTDSEKIKRVIHLTKLTEFIDLLPEKENSIISDFGSDFSGGECQRIALARALYKNSDVLLLDEPTAALDAVTSEYIINTLKTHCKSKTIIMVTHDIGKALLASKATVIENGNLVKYGLPSELLKKHGKFYQLYQAHQNLNNN